MGAEEMHGCVFFDCLKIYEQALNHCTVRFQFLKNQTSIKSH